jgi:hypothetical protein
MVEHWRILPSYAKRREVSCTLICNIPMGSMPAGSGGVTGALCNAPKVGCSQQIENCAEIAYIQTITL